ncbi:nitrite reductase small subunit NirD [Halomonas sp. HAL1]|uniref:nitrite reductase small subunit NirD n=1 Tax=Halomonas sp. HAL1 TaxID=550984 RepID=UPI00022D30B7|nr:nitrite reductase small subunit NirD [Halomonas sp. HAL1]EHA15818.1 assimilatory nitrite reductase, NAD(P)H, small subunit [Halomonas sp. HAL1]WKV93905.1 nitrite reductase small subunit NirD [Halomonas sp. HAL1]
MTATALKKEMDMADVPNSKAWQKACTKAELVAFSGVAAWLETADGPAQVAIFYLPGLRGQSDELYALDHHDPFSNANVIARGIVGDLKGAPVVASPIYKQHFRLEDGQCLEDESVKLRTWKIEFKGNEVWVEG